MFEAELNHCRDEFLQAVAEGDLPEAYRTLMVLAEYQESIHSERVVLESLNTRFQMAQDTCEKHGVWCCPECFDMEWVEGEELMDRPELDRDGWSENVWAGARRDEARLDIHLHREATEAQTEYWIAEADAMQRTLDQIAALPCIMPWAQRPLGQSWWS